MNDNTTPEDDMPSDEVIAAIDAIIEDVQKQVEGKSMDYVLCAFAFIVAENCDTTDELAVACAELMTRVVRGYESIKRSRTLN